MKISLFTQNRNLPKSSKNVSFEGGMTPEIMNQIQKTDILDITKRLEDKNIQTDFKNNKVIAWSCNKIIDIYEQIYKKFKIKMALPTEIHVENFEDLKNENEINDIGLCLFFPSKIYKNSDNITQGESIFFNTMNKARSTAAQEAKRFYDWNNIDEISDVQMFNRNASTNHFLYNFLHEFSHVAHENNLLNKIDPQDLPYFILEHNDKDYQKIFNDKYKKLAQLTCDYAGTNPFETIACDLPLRITGALDSDLNVVKNPFKDTPYEKLSK